MKNIFTTLFLSFVMMFGVTGCSKVPAGHVGVKVYLLGGEKGVDHEVKGVGRYWLGINEELYLFPTFTQNYVWTSDDNGSDSRGNESISFQTAEGLSVNADVGISYFIEQDKVSNVFQKYRRGVDEITDTYLRNMVRDSLNRRASVLPVESVYGRGKTELMDNVIEDVRAQVSDIGINIEKIYWINDIRLPATVLAALNAKIEATQKAQQRENEVAQAKAEADKKVEEARGIAESMKLTNLEVTDKVLRLRELENQSAWIEKWNGVLPATMAGEGTTNLLNLSK